MSVPLKVPRSASPAARAGAGDISAKELSRERCNLHSTPINKRAQPSHPKKQLFSAPVNKFTAKTSTSPSPNLERIKSCLEEYRRQNKPVNKTPEVVFGPKAASMEDLTPSKRRKVDRQDNLAVVKSREVHSSDEEQAAARIGKFMLVVAWRRRREEIRYVRKTLECQVSCSERLRIQVSALKSLLDSDNAKVQMAMRELERLKQLLRDKEMEKTVLEREKQALERDVSAAEDRASEMTIGWHNCRNELEGERRALAAERAAAAGERARRERAQRQVAILAKKVQLHEEAAHGLNSQTEALRAELAERQKQLADLTRQLASEQETRGRCERACAALGASAAAAARERAALGVLLADLRQQLAELRDELQFTRNQLEMWPKPLTRMLGAARSWFHNPKSISDAVLWSLVPSRHGC